MESARARAMGVLVLTDAGCDICGSVRFRITARPATETLLGVVPSEQREQAGGVLAAKDLEFGSFDSLPSPRAGVEQHAARLPKIRNPVQDG
jgi:hypothetical protein